MTIMRGGLSRKILVPTLGIIALGLVAVLTMEYVNARAIVRQELIKRIDREVTLTTKLIDSWLQARLIDISAWSQQQVFVEALTEGGYYGRSAREGAETLLGSLKTGYPHYESLFLANQQGEIIALAPQTSDSAQVHLADRSYFQRTLQGQPVISDVIVSRFSSHKTFAVTAPVMVQGQAVGVLGGVVDFSTFKSLFLDDFRVKQYGYAFLVDSHNQVLGSSHDNESTLANQANETVLQRITAEKKGIFTHEQDHNELLAVFQHLNRTDWAFVIDQSLDNTLHPISRIFRVNFAGALLILLILSLLIVHLFYRQIVRRLRDMLRVTMTVRQGDFSPRITTTTTIPDEITELTDSFNTMIAQLEQTVGDLHEEIGERRQAEAKLAHHQGNLERIIEERSAALQKEVEERQRTEERLVRAEKLEMIGTLAGGVAHDLNNILSGIVSYPDLLLMKLTPASPLYPPLRTIKESGEKAAAIVQDLLTLARRGVSVKEPVQLNTLVRDYLASPEFTHLQSHHPAIRVFSDCAPDLLPILGSPVHLSKTIMNLITNAAEAMEQGGEVHIRTENRYVDNSLRRYEKINQGEYVVLEVIDHGSGIGPEELDKIFTPFYSSKKMGKSGTGLGMAVVWGTVKDHDGYIDCDSTLGMGTTFSLYFPVTAQRQQSPRAEEQGSETMRGQGEHILVVDDVAEQREIAASILAELGYQTTTAASGEEAMRVFAEQRFDLVLLDMILGEGMDGLDTYRQMIRQVPGQPAIITSGFSQTDRIAEAIRLGVGQYIKKPYMIKKLGQAIRDELPTG